MIKKNQPSQPFPAYIPSLNGESVKKHPAASASGSRKKTDRVTLSSEVKSEKHCRKVVVKGMKRPAPGKNARMTELVHFPCEPIFSDDLCLRQDHYWDQVQEDIDHFRKIGGSIGLAQPTEKGIDLMMEKIGSEKEVIWSNLRGEPVVLIKGQPFTLRSKDEILSSLYYRGVKRPKTEDMEKALKNEIINKIKSGEGFNLGTGRQFTENTTVHIPAGSLKPQDVKTLTEVYQKAQKKYPNLDYQRIAINDRTRPSNRDFDTLVERFKNYHPNAEYLNNCLAGYGRTTSAMTVFNIMKNVRENPEGGFTEAPALREEIKETGKGRWGALRGLLGAGKIADSVIRHFITDGKGEKEFNQIIAGQAKGGYDLKNDIEAAMPKNRREARDYLERYIYLSAFYQYCREEGPQNYRQSFSQWVKPHETKLNTAVAALDKVYRLEAALKKVK